jgi:hypothetical protein
MCEASADEHLPLAPCKYTAFSAAIEASFCRFDSMASAVIWRTCKVAGEWSLFRDLQNKSTGCRRESAGNRSMFKHLLKQQLRCCV